MLRNSCVGAVREPPLQGVEQRMVLFFLYATLSLLARPLAAEVFTFDSAEKWQTWQLPQGLVQLGPSGHLELIKFRKGIDPVRDASGFFHDTMEREAVPGGIFRAGSNPGDAFKVIDGDYNTFWQPDPADPLAKWEVEIDLGRAVLAQELRLRFPDQEGARPLRQFTVYVATGATIDPRKDIFRFESVYQTTLPNEETEIRIGLSGRNDTTRVLDPGLDVVLEDAARFRVIHYIRIGVDEQSADAALAEVEVSAVGDNLSLGVLERGGTFATGLVVRDVVGLVDGDMNTYANKFTTYRATSGWRNEGLWWELDLGGQFWIDEIFLYFNNQGEGASGSSVRNGGTGFAFLVSDGQRTTSGDVDYDRLVGHGNEQDPFAGPERHYRYLFEPRKVRYLFWHGFLRGAPTSLEWHARAAELMLFSPGYPAQVVLRSGFIDLGQIVGDGRPKAIKHLSWDAELPVGTRMQLRSRSGVVLSEEYAFHNKIGEVVTEEKWLSLPKVLRGQVDTALVVGEDWGEWSNVYQLSGEAFQSDSPRRFVQLEALLSTEDPRVAPVLRSLSIEFEDALVTEAKGEIWPRQAPPNEDTRFTYTLWPTAAEDDSGFDRLRLIAPGGWLEADEVEVNLAGETIAPEEVAQRGDSLFVNLGQRVGSDSLAVHFTARLWRNATVFSAELGHGDRPGLWQSVEAAARRANVVLLPALAGSDRLIGDLEVAPTAFTPNGDGVNDQVQIRFVIFKVETATPRVRVFDLAGRMVTELSGAGEDFASYTWSGRDAQGVLVPPGLYLCHIDLGATAGESVAVRPVAVIY